MASMREQEATAQLLLDVRAERVFWHNSYRANAKYFYVAVDFCEKFNTCLSWSLKKTHLKRSSPDFSLN